VAVPSDAVSLLGWIVVGFLAGSLAGAATGRRAGGCLSTMLVGVLGAVVGGLLLDAVGERGVDHFGLWSIFVAFVGASVLLLLFGGLRHRR
jgi:uncharacterized membrane protein YeaQ/YmgE (transglycosylase-associated protein family)